MAKWNVRSNCLINNRYLNNNSGMGVIGVAVALNVVIVLGGATLFMASEYEERNLTRSIKAAQLDDANKNALFLAGKLLEPAANLLAIDPATLSFKDCNTFDSWRDAPTYTFANGTTVTNVAGGFNTGTTETTYPTAYPTSSPSPTVSHDKIPLWSAATPPAEKNLSVQFGFCDPNKQGPLSSAGVPINTMTCQQLVAASLGNSGSNNMEIIAVSSTLDGVTRSLSGARKMQAGAAAFPWPKNLALSGPVGGGSEITFKPVQPGILIDVGENPCPPIASTPDTGSGASVTCRVPAHASGTVNITFKEADGTPISDATPGTFEYLASPTITLLTPSSGPSSGGNPVTITGTNFNSASRVEIDGVDVGAIVAPLPAITPTQITYNAPPRAGGGSASVRVINPNLEIAGVLRNPVAPTSNSSTYTYNNKPLISALSVNSGPEGGGTIVVISGTGFNNAGPSFKVTFNNTQATVTSFSGTSITVQAPAGSGGNSGPVVVTNNDGQVSNNDFIYTWMFLPPVLVSLSPSSGASAGGYSVRLNGSGFALGAKVSWNGSVLPAAAVTVNNANQITVSPAPGGPPVTSAAVFVLGVDNQASATQNFNYGNNPPAITSMSPTSGPATGGTVVTFNGTDFRSGAQINFNGVLYPTTTFSSTQLTFTTPAYATNTSIGVNVFVHNSDLLDSAPPLTFNYQASAPTISSISPNSGPPGGGGTITISGNGFVSGQTQIIWNGAALAAIPTGTNSVTTTNPNTLKFTLPASSPVNWTGNINVAVRIPGVPTALTSTNRTFTYSAPTPTITSLNFNSGQWGGTNVIQVRGTGFTASSTARVGVNNATVAFVNSTTLNVTIPPFTYSNVYACHTPLTITTAGKTSASMQYFYSGYTGILRADGQCDCWRAATDWSPRPDASGVCAGGNCRPVSPYQGQVLAPAPKSGGCTASCKARYGSSYSANSVESPISGPCI